MADPTLDPRGAPAPQPVGNELRSAILSMTTLKEEPLVIPEWGGITVLIREMDGTTRANVLEGSDDPRTGKRSGKLFYPLIAIASCFDPATGKPIFEPADRDSLNAIGGAALERICQAAVRISGLDAAQFQQAKND